jgi:hypothetical protein
MSRSMARALVAALVLLVSGLTAGTAVARDGSPPWWHWHHGHGTPATSTTATKGGGGDDGDDDDDQGRGTTTTGATTTATVTTTTTTTATAAPSVPAPATTTGPAAAPAPAAAAPVLDRTVAVAATAGSVNVRRPGSADAQPLTTAPLALPTGTRVDTRHGEVALTSAVDARGTTQTGRFSGGVFEVRAAAHGYTQLVLVGGHWASCTTTDESAAHAAYVGARAHAAKKRRAKPIRSLWGQDDHGRFQTRGSGSVATVRGTRWRTTDTCAGTTTTVTRGAVDVRSRRTGKTRRVTAGHSLFVAR